MDFFVLFVAVGIVDDSDGEGAGGALGDVISEFDFLEGDLELVSTGTGVVKDTSLCVKVQVFNFDLVVYFG